MGDDEELCLPGFCEEWTLCVFYNMQYTTVAAVHTITAVPHTLPLHADSQFLLSVDTNSLSNASKGLLLCLHSSGEHSFARPFPDTGSAIALCPFPWSSCHLDRLPQPPALDSSLNSAPPIIFYGFYFSKLPYVKSFASVVKPMRCPRKPLSSNEK